MQPDTFTFLFIGRIASEKGIDELVNAFSRLKEYNCRLIIIGPDESDIDPINQETTQIMHNDPRIIMTGEQKDIRPWLAAADMLVLPSHREGFPNVVLEAGAMGVPAIVTDINGSREIIRNEYNGLVIPLGNDYTSRTQTLYEAMRSILDNKEKVHKMASVSRRYILENWDRQIVLDALLQFYRNLFGGISPTART
ncbi:MAG: glycosyltransferase [Bacteroidales bacterium]|nr:glycosyltransferase [Bacteroidales bacterium]